MISGARGVSERWLESGETLATNVHTSNIHSSPPEPSSFIYTSFPEWWGISAAWEPGGVGLAFFYGGGHLQRAAGQDGPATHGANGGFQEFFGGDSS